jgi:hypothetical protein
LEPGYYFEQIGSSLVEQAENVSPCILSFHIVILSSGVLNSSVPMNICIIRFDFDQPHLFVGDATSPMMCIFIGDLAPPTNIWGAGLLLWGLPIFIG